MTEAQAKRMGFGPIPWMENLLRGPQYYGEWMRELKRPHCKEYWHRDRPNEIRREWYSSPYQTSPSYQNRTV